MTDTNNSKPRMFAVGRAFAVLLASMFMFSGPDVAYAAESDNSIIISVQNQANTNGVSEKKPVEGVKSLLQIFRV